MYRLHVLLTFSFKFIQPSHGKCHFHSRKGNPRITQEMLWNKTELKHMLLLNKTVTTTQAYLRLNHIPFRLIEENFACSRLRDGRVCESEKARTRNKTRGRPQPTAFPRSRDNIFACVSLTRHPYYMRAWNRPNRTGLVGMVAYIYH